MSSGIQVDPVCMDIFKEMKVTKVGKKQTRKMAFFRISDDVKTVISDDSPLGCHEVSRNPDDDKQMFDLLKSILEETKDANGKHRPLYILYDFIFNSRNGARVEKLSFIAWCPDSAGIKSKMVFASTKDAILKKFDGVAKSFQISAMDDLDYEEMKTKVEKAN